MAVWFCVHKALLTSLPVDKSYALTHPSWQAVMSIECVTCKSRTSSLVAFPNVKRLPDLPFLRSQTHVCIDWREKGGSSKIPKRKGQD